MNHDISNPNTEISWLRYLDILEDLSMTRRLPMAQVGDVHFYTLIPRGSGMHRTQIYLQNDLYDTLKSRAAHMKVSISELIRRTLERDIHKDPVADAQGYFERLQPLESFAAVDAQTYVRNIRSQSRILRQGDTT